jgi:pyruvate kinase
VIQEQGHDTHIIAKIEKPEALLHIQGIIEAVDAIMVARGDLGVEIAPEEVPIVQNQLIQRARALSKPVIFATQMLESMISTARPTRAEVTDVSNAVYCGTDAVMLSAETAAGKYPVQAVEMMLRIINQTEAFMLEQQSFAQLNHRDTSLNPIPLGDAVADATAQICDDLQAKLIIGITGTGWTVGTLSSARPSAPIIGVSDQHEVCQRMNLYWGVIPVFSTKATHTHPNPLARELALDTGLVEKQQHVIIVRGFHKQPDLNTPTITMLKL